jgi:hypothetical protein
MMAPTDQQRRANRRLGWMLAALALAFGAGFVVKIVFFGF